ncbi:hypothetical protein [Paenisporosarcina sp.]|uniref:hypothetical protein n=1 Tax=Paenisporosarcina sp. TaxID=1932001 RepID=UPI003C785C14
MKTPAGIAKCRNPLERLVRISSAQARGKRSSFAEYQPPIGLIIAKQQLPMACGMQNRRPITDKKGTKRHAHLLIVDGNQFMDQPIFP